MSRKKISINDLYRKKAEGEKVSWLTCYDFPTAQFQETAGIEMILEGDSMGMCVYGYGSTVPVTMDQCIFHCEAVRRGPGLYRGIQVLYPGRQNQRFPRRATLLSHHQG